MGAGLHAIGSNGDNDAGGRTEQRALRHASADGRGRRGAARQTQPRELKASARASRNRSTAVNAGATIRAVISRTARWPAQRTNVRRRTFAESRAAGTSIRFVLAIYN